MRKSKVFVEVAREEKTHFSSVIVKGSVEQIEEFEKGKNKLRKLWSIGKSCYITI